MTNQELLLLQRSANLCNQRNQLLSRLNTLKAQLSSVMQNLPSDPARAARHAGEEAVKGRFFPSIWVWCVALIVCILPIILCAAVYKIAGIENEYFLLIGIGIGFALFYIALILCWKADRKKVRKKVEQEYLYRYRKNCQHYQVQYKQLSTQIRDLMQQYNQLVRRMQDPTQCSIPASQWYQGQQLYRLIHSGRASTLQEAIHIQSQINTQEAAYWQQVRDYPRMVEEQIAADNRKFLDDMEKMALIGMILSD